MTMILKRAAMLTAVVGLMVGWQTMARAASPEQELVEKARLTAERLLSHPKYPTLRTWVKRAKGVMVVPSLLKAGFFIGGEGGGGVLLARDPVKGWSYPAFYSLGSGSIGAQIGFQDSQVIFVIMTDKGLRAMIDDNLKLGADASIAVGTDGAGIEGATTVGLGADVYSFSMNRGIFGGLSLEGTVAVERNGWNESYYGTGATPKGIVLEHRFANAKADGLRRALNLR